MGCSKATIKRKRFLSGVLQFQSSFKQNTQTTSVCMANKTTKNAAMHRYNKERNLARQVCSPLRQIPAPQKREVRKDERLSAGARGYTQMI